MTNQTFGAMETEFRAKRAAGRKLLVPYITGGLTGWQDAVRAAVEGWSRAASWIQQTFSR